MTRLRSQRPVILTVVSIKILLLINVDEMYVKDKLNGHIGRKLVFSVVFFFSFYIYRQLLNILLKYYAIVYRYSFYYES